MSFEELERLLKLATEDSVAAARSRDHWHATCMKAVETTREVAAASEDMRQLGRRAVFRLRSRLSNRADHIKQLERRLAEYECIEHPKPDHECEECLKHLVAHGMEGRDA